MSNKFQGLQVMFMEASPMVLGSTIPSTTHHLQVATLYAELRPFYRRVQHLRFNLHRLQQALATLAILFTSVLVTKLSSTDATRTGSDRACRQW
jgi:hypothetical protein